MISKQQYRNILLEQIREQQEKRRLEKSERRRSPAPQQELYIVGQHKKLHTHYQEQQRPMMASNVHDEYSYKPASASNSNRGRSQNRHLRIERACEVKIYQDSPQFEDNNVSNPSNEQEDYQLYQSGSLKELKGFPSPRSNPFSEVAPVSPPIKDIYQQGARNLLKLENIDQAEIDSRHKKRLQMQKMLKEQMQEIERRKKSERERRITEEKKELESNQRYLQEVQKRIEIENQKKEDRIIRQSGLSLEAQAQYREVKVLADEQRLVEERKSKITFKQFKAKRAMKESKVAEINEQENAHNPAQLPIVQSRKYRSQIPLQNPLSQRHRKSAQSNRLSQNRPPTITESELVDSSHVSEMQESIKSNSSNSNDTAKRQEYRKMQLMIAQIRKDIKLQELMFKKEIEKARREAVQAVQEKKQLEEQFARLKEQLTHTNHGDSNLDEYYEFDVRKFNKVDTERKAIKSEVRRRKFQKKESSLAPIRPTAHEVLRSKRYRLEEQSVDENCMKSLLAESKKIPLSITPNRNQVLTMSKIEEYAIDGSRINNKQSSKFQKKQIIRTDDYSMNEFLANPYCLVGTSEQKPNQKEQLIDFELSSMDSSAVNEVSHLVERQRRAVVQSGSGRPQKFILRNSSTRNSRTKSERDSSGSQTVQIEHRRFHKIMSIQEAMKEANEDSSFKHRQASPLEGEAAIQQNCQ